MTDKGQENTLNDSIDWKSVFRRKDRPLPKAGCSWAFYLFLLGLIVLFVFYYIKYKQQ